MSGTGKTPGQAAYEATQIPVLPEGCSLTPWETLPRAVREFWDTAANAAIAAGAAPAHERAAELLGELNAVRDELATLKATLEDSGAEHPSCDAHRWYAVVKHYGSFAYGFAATQDGLRAWDDVSEFEQAKARDFG